TMNTEPDPKPNSSPATSGSEPPKSQEAAAQQAAAKAYGQARENVVAGVAAFKKLDVQTQIYLVALVVAALCGLIFSVISVSVKTEGPIADLMKQHASAMPTVTAFNAGANGCLAVLA